MSNTFADLEDIDNMNNTNNNKEGKGETNFQKGGENISTKEWVTSSFDKGKTVSQGDKSVDEKQINQEVVDRDANTNCEEDYNRKEEQSNSSKILEPSKESSKKKISHTDRNHRVHEEGNEKIQLQVYDKELQELMVLEGITPKVIKVQNMLENSNQTKKDFDENDLEENINQMAKVADL
ncbi:hypothetical protein FXO38_23234 [Capsicum annuum]|nr:hypothetical protein FXO38_23234 [Capsicum annuum]KAF3641495.1 hypothetical protein FXO37_22975 [Capsicum annuum]